MAKVYSLDDAIDALSHINPNCGRKQWVSVGMAAKDAGIAFSTFDQWSARANDGSYKGERDCQQQWNSFKGGAVTAGTLFAIAKAEGWRSSESEHPTQSAPATARKTKQRAQRSEPQPIVGAALDALVKNVLAVCVNSDPLHAYLLRKQVDNAGMLSIDDASAERVVGYRVKRGDDVLTGDLLVLPLRGFNDAAVRAFEFIDARGIKTGLANVKRAALWWSPVEIEATPDPDWIVIAEGAATLLSFAVAWPHPNTLPIAALSSGNMRNVARAAAEKYPEAQIVICGDAGNGSAAADEAAAEVGGISVIPPPELLPEGGTDWNDVVLEHGYIPVRAWLAEHARAETEVALIGPNGERPVIDFLLPGLPRGNVGMISGPGGVGKTMLMLQLLPSLALGRSLIGSVGPDWVCADRKLRVGLLLGEDERVIIQSRMIDIMKEYGVNAGEFHTLQSMLHIHSFVGEDMRMLISERGTVHEGGFATWCRRFCARHDVIVIDPLVALHDAQENDNTAASALIRLLSRIGRDSGCSILVLHHFSKAGASRGASAFATSVRWAADLAPISADDAATTGIDTAKAVASHVTLKLTKHNYQGRVDPISFVRTQTGVLRATHVEHVPDRAGELPANAAASHPKVSRTSRSVTTRHVADDDYTH